LLRIGGKRKPRSTEASGASRTGNLGEGMGGVVSRPLKHTTARAGLGSGGSQQLRQLSDVGGDAPGLVLGEQLGRRTPTGRVLDVEVAERLPVGVANDEAPACSSISQGGGKRAWAAWERFWHRGTPLWLS
jgi:hypothetical protein